MLTDQDQDHHRTPNDHNHSLARPGVLTPPPDAPASPPTPPKMGYALMRHTFEEVLPDTLTSVRCVVLPSVLPSFLSQAAPSLLLQRTNTTQRPYVRL